VILDSPVGEHHGGPIGAPVFQRIVQQTLEYLHTPHDVELPENRSVLVAARQSREKEDDLREGSPDRLSDIVEIPDLPDPIPVPPMPSPDPTEKVALTAPSELARHVSPPEPPKPASAPPRTASVPPGNGTVIVDIEPGGVLVPSFAGKSVRAAIETAEENGLDLDIVGSGLGEDQSPPAGTHVAMGSKVTVRFGR
jgi:hypothetical protein